MLIPRFNLQYHGNLTLDIQVVKLSFKNSYTASITVKLKILGKNCYTI